MLAAGAWMGATAQVSATSGNDALTEKLLEMIASDTHWDEANLANAGMSKLVSEKEMDEECGEFSYFVYGRNVKAEKGEGWNVTLEATGEHAMAIEVLLDTDNRTNLYFKDKADHDAFLSVAKKSAHYTSDEHNARIGGSLIEHDEQAKGWWVITFHAG